MKRIMLVAVVMLLAVRTAMAVDITVDNTKRNYLIYVPKNLGENRPLLISCHGMNQDAAYQKNMLSIESVADTAKFVTVFPNGIDKSWDIGGDRDIRFVLALIDEMVSKYNIDPSRVYLSGFSMGGMFTYHAMNKIPDQIAAFAPISGYPMGGATANSNVRPLPIIHTHGTADDVVNFGGVQGALNVWIKHNGCPTSPKVTTRYRGANHITRRVWGPGNEGVEVVLMEMADKGHWISNDNGVKTGDEIWRFCKRFSLNKTDPYVKISSPVEGLVFNTYGGPSEIPPITVEASAVDPDGGEVVKMSFYDNGTLVAEDEEAPFSCVIESLTAGTHTISAVATDNDGNTGSSEVVVSVKEPTIGITLTSTFNEAGAVPDWWSTYDGEVHRTGYVSGFNSGSRVFKFTGEKHDFEWGLYTRNVTGAHHAGYARFGDEGSLSTLMLYPGNYQIYYTVTNWNRPEFSPVTIAVETIDGKEAYSETYTPEVNIGNSPANSFSGAPTRSMVFDVLEKGRYVITFYTADEPWADLVVGKLIFRRKGDVTAIRTVDSTATPDGQAAIYSLDGRRLSNGQLRPGIYIQSGKKKIIK